MDRALELFWRNGYEGTSITDLTEAIGISRPSLYAAFGDRSSCFGLFWPNMLPDLERISSMHWTSREQLTRSGRSC